MKTKLPYLANVLDLLLERCALPVVEVAIVWRIEAPKLSHPHRGDALLDDFSPVLAHERNEVVGERTVVEPEQRGYVGPIVVGAVRELARLYRHKQTVQKHVLLSNHSSFSDLHDIAYSDTARATVTMTYWAPSSRGRDTCPP